MFPPEVTATAELYRLDQAAGVESYQDEGPVTGGFFPMSMRNHVMEGGTYVDPHYFVIPQDIDVKVGDQLRIDGETYHVRLVYSAIYGGIKHRRLSLSRQV